MNLTSPQTSKKKVLILRAIFLQNLDTPQGSKNKSTFYKYRRVFSSRIGRKFSSFPTVCSVVTLGSIWVRIPAPSLGTTTSKPRYLPEFSQRPVPKPTSLETHSLGHHHTDCLKVLPTCIQMSGLTVSKNQLILEKETLRTPLPKEGKAKVFLCIDQPGQY